MGTRNPHVQRLRAPGKTLLALFFRCLPYFFAPPSGGGVRSETDTPVQGLREKARPFAKRNGDWESDVRRNLCTRGPVNFRSWPVRDVAGGLGYDAWIIDVS